ncbi:hypothetical protein YK48G_17020 [Lentilactobacillus fungorum]|uniref:HTH araC/xylS-type domain-containing protein n=1 Tax=Lentilactobacillus fungorum TaxID=2201250 RepID=A0ABQ3W178_9LACO|nr:helix-turn-helix domain-containing protein [Lentilactobacillus fungorum]GHP14277.1 hypothetical protein YK48G_17020 [Lentilactobacillus fungorum]
MSTITPNKTKSALYQTIAHEMNQFSKVSQINGYYFDLNNRLLIDGHVFTSPTEIIQNLPTANTNSFFIFPVILKNDLAGFIICEGSGITPERIKLARTFLGNIFNNAFKPTNPGEVAVLNSLKIDDLANVTVLRKLIDISGLNDSRSTTLAINSMTHLNNDSQVNIQRALTFIKSNINQPLSLESVAKAVFLSPSYLSKAFKQKLGVNFINYVNSLKIAFACEKLITTNSKVSAIASQLGYSQTSYFTKIFKSYAGMTPLVYRKRNASVDKIYTIPRDLSWSSSDSVYDVSKRFFNRHHIPYYFHSVNGYPYISRIGDYTDSGDERGWIYTIDCGQPMAPAAEITVNKKSVIQWTYAAAYIK